MTTAKEILDMIEAVDANDANAMREIDRAVFQFVMQGRAVHLGENPQYQKYCVSRDALKQIRPEGWQFKLIQDGGSNTFNASLSLYGSRSTLLKHSEAGWTHDFKLEELAELHAIIQAIEYERTKS